LIQLFEGFDIVFLDLAREKIIPSLRMLITTRFEVRTLKTVGQFFKKIHFRIRAAMGSGNQPAISIFLSMGRAEHLGTGHVLPACLPG
jgi:hypothetical protein